MTVIILRRKDGSESEATLEDDAALGCSTVMMRHRLPVVARAEDLARTAPASVLIDRYGPAGRAWAREHPSPRQYESVTYQWAGEKDGRPLFVETP